MDLLRPISRYIVTPIYSLKEKSRLLRILKDLEKTQWLTYEALHEIQQQKLKTLLIHAYETVDYYHDVFTRAGFSPYRMSEADDLRDVPVLTKRDIIRHSGKMVSRLFHHRDLVKACTGGSTGTQLHFYVNKGCVHQRDACAWRHNRWANWDLGMPVGALWGNPPKAGSFKSRVRQGILKRTSYLDTINMDSESIMDFVRKINRHETYALFGHSHSLYLLADFLSKERIPVNAPAGIVSTSMMLMDNERKLIEEVLRQKVFDRYGCEEVGLISSECERHDGMHMNIDHLLIEFITESGRPALPGEEGRILLTDLSNFGMPFIRYEVGDVGVPADRLCACGRGLPLMEKVRGRTADFLIKENGSRVAGVSLIERVLTNNPAIMQLQIVQDSISRFTFNIVMNEGYSREKAVRSLKRDFARIFPNASMEFEFVERVEQEISGKYRFAICNV